MNLTEDNLDRWLVGCKLYTYERNQLIQQILENQEKAEKWDNLMNSFTFDFEPVDDVEETARQFIDNEVRTTHKLYEENKRLKEFVTRIKEWRDSDIQTSEGSMTYCIDNATKIDYILEEIFGATKEED